MARQRLFAQGTTVAPERTRAEIEEAYARPGGAVRLLPEAGGTGTGTGGAFFERREGGVR